MRHRLANKSLSRPTAHRILMLRNLVSSLLQFQQIQTTLIKAKETQKQVERIITLGKKPTKSNWDQVNAYLLNPTVTLRPLFTTYAQRYANRSGGYTRITKAGNRQGDNAPLAILELVDSPHDLKFETTAASVGREFALLAQKAGEDKSIWKKFRTSIESGVNHVDMLDRLAKEEGLKELTRVNCRKALAFRISHLDDSTTSALVDELSTASPPLPTTTVESSSSTPVSITADLAQVSIFHPPTPIKSFLDRSYVHYLRSVATFKTLSVTPTLDPIRTVKQLSARLNPSERKGLPSEVLTQPRLGRVPRAGESTEGWSYDDAEDQRRYEKGGPISRAKGPRGREGRRSEWTGKRRSEVEGNL